MAAQKSHPLFSSILSLLLALTFLPSRLVPQGHPAPDKKSFGSGLLVSPRRAAAGDTVRVLAVSETGLEAGRIEVHGPSGAVPTANPRAGGGPPFWWSAEFRPDGEGAYAVALVRDAEVTIRQEVRVFSKEPRPDGPASTSGIEGGWDRAAENLYSAWLERLFSESDESSSWKALHEVTADGGRNILFNFLGLGEDDPGGPEPVRMTPDCADAPYFFRAYFAWKTGLPFGYRQCTRGSLGQPPRCPEWFSLDIPAASKNKTRDFNRFLSRVMNAIHSGSARTRLDDDQSDYYPLALTRDALRPGAVFADPYGHTLVIVRWTPQAAEHPGQLLAADAQPDGTIGLKRFWRGNFLFNTKEVIGQPGFKAFRPVRRAPSRPRPLTDAEIRLLPDGSHFSLEQKDMAADEFYDRMERLINPEPLDPSSALAELVSAFHQQLLTRVLSVANAEDYLRAHPGAVIPMPAAPAAVFQDLGLWEDYSTPNRDMRLLIALDVLLGFPEKAARSPQSFIWPKDATPERMTQELTKLLARLSRDASIRYMRSDGQPQSLSIEEILKRGPAFEMAYNPNDAVEVRWGAPEESPERASAVRRAPADQVRRMASLRRWFRSRLRPPT